MTSRQSINITQSRNLSNNPTTISDYQLHCFFYKIIQSNKHGIVHMKYQTIMIIVLHSATPYQGSCSAITACSPPLIRRRSMELSCSRSRSPPPKASSQPDISISGSSSSAASSPPPVSYLGSTYRPQGVTRQRHSPKYHHE